MTGSLQNKWSIGYCSVLNTSPFTLSMCTVSTVMFLDVSDLLNRVRQFLSWNINMHWQRLISCGYRTYPTELLMAEMIDVLSLNNGVAIPCCLQSATRAISEMLRRIKISFCAISWSRVSFCKNWVFQGDLTTDTFIHFIHPESEPLSQSGVYISHRNSSKKWSIVLYHSNICQCRWSPIKDNL